MFKHKKLKLDISKRQLYRRIAKENQVVLEAICSNNVDIVNDEITELVHTASSAEESSCSQPVSNFRNVPSENNFQSNEISDIVEPLSNFNSSIPDIDTLNGECSANVSLDNSNALMKPDLHTQLQEWALESKASHSSITSLLRILKPLHPELPLDSRSLLKTPRFGVFQNLDNGEYCHFGIQNALIHLIPSSCKDEKIKLSINIDGIPLFSSSKLQFWPILGLIRNFASSPFVIGIFCGNSKPSPLKKFLKKFIDEMIDLRISGFILHNMNYSVEILNFICDAPAKAYIKGIKSHGGYSSCDKCWEFGDYSHTGGKVIFKGTSSSLRTDEQFVKEEDTEHHMEKTPLLDLKIGLVSTFTIDYMHAVCLGVMKKMLVSWISGGLQIRVRHATVALWSENLLYLRPFIPAEFNRKPRSLSDLSYWKATEFRNFLLYFGPFVLKDNTDISVFEHFLLLHVGITLLVSDMHLSCFGAENAHKILNTFIEHCEYIYGSNFYVYNTHVLCHLANECTKFGTLDSFSAFPFENFLGFIKSCVRSPQKPLQQIHRRLIERNFLYAKSKVIEDHYVLNIEHNEGPVLTLNTIKQFKKMVGTNFTLSVTSHSFANSYFMTKSGDVAEINNICTTTDGNIFLIGKKFLNYESYYVYPLDSKDLDIFVVSNLSQMFESWSVSDIKNKCFLFPNKLIDKKNFITFPLLHNLY